MSKVEHPAHYGGADNPYEVIKVLRRWLTPTEFLGFCKGNTLKYTARANQKGGLEDHLKATFYSKEVSTFVMDQRAAGEPDGMPIPPLHWTDTHPFPQEDRDDAIACSATGCVVMLCSSVEPHVRWIVRYDGGEDAGMMTELFKDKYEARRFIDGVLKAGKLDTETGTQRATQAAQIGNVKAAAEICEAFRLAWSHEPGSDHAMIAGTRVEVRTAPADGA
jgi:hypothetical protein